MKAKKHRKGFTLVELLIVIGISGILMAMAAPKYKGMVDKATQLEQRAHVREALSYIDIHNLEEKIRIEETVTIEAAGKSITASEFPKILERITISKKLTIAQLRVFAESGVSPLALEP